MAKDADYEHIIINQNSTDGTRQFLNSLLYEGFYKLKVKHNEENTGDAGGMKDGFDMISPDCRYIMQLDNDSYPLTEDFIQKLVDAMDTDPKIGTIMMKREGVGHILEMTDFYKEINGVKYYKMLSNHAMFYRVSSLKSLNYWVTGETIGWVKYIPNMLQRRGDIIVKTPDIRVMHTDTTGGQGKKFPKLAPLKRDFEKYKNFKYEI